jgi:hypothetical protein
MACDLPWYFRNKAYHDGISFDVLQLSRNVNKVSMEHLMAWKNVPNNLVVEKWIPTPHSIFKIIFDIAIRDTFLVQTAVCQNHKGKII